MDIRPDAMTRSRSGLAPFDRRRQSPYPVLPSHQALRLAFVGQETYFRSCSLAMPVGGIEPSFIDFRAGADPTPMLAELDRISPQVVIAFRPEVFPAGCFAGRDALTVGYLTEPLPRPGSDHRDLERRREYLDALDPANFDRLISFDPLIVSAAEGIAPIWRSLPLPVADEYYAPVSDPHRPGRALFIGRSTEHRELFLAPVKHEFDLMHIAHGATDQALRDFLHDTDIGINLHNENYPTFENRCATVLAAGNLLISEKLSPTHGLEPELDFLEVTVPQELQRALSNAIRNPAAFRRIRVRGRQKAEYFRASRVYPALVSDLLLDVGVFGRDR